MKKTVLFVFDMFVVNFLLFTYLFTVGSFKLIEGRGTDWFTRSIALSGIGAVTDLIALVIVSLTIALLFRNKMQQNYIYSYIFGTIIIAASFMLKVQIGHDLFNLQSSVQPIAVIIFSLALSIVYFVDFYKKFEEKKVKVDAIFVGASMEQSLRLKNFARIHALAKNADDLVKVNKENDSGVYILLDLSLEEIKKIMAYLSFSECRVACLYSTEDNKPNLTDSEVEKWSESHDFILIEYEKFISEII